MLNTTRRPSAERDRPCAKDGPGHGQNRMLPFPSDSIPSQRVRCQPIRRIAIANPLPQTQPQQSNHGLSHGLSHGYNHSLECMRLSAWSRHPQLGWQHDGAKNTPNAALAGKPSTPLSTGAVGACRRLPPAAAMYNRLHVARNVGPLGARGRSRLPSPLRLGAIKSMRHRPPSLGAHCCRTWRLSSLRPRRCSHCYRRAYRFRRALTFAMCLIMLGRFSGNHSLGTWSSRHSWSAGAIPNRTRTSVSMCSEMTCLALCVYPEYVASQSLPSIAV
mmetsp:Transcript_24100/g.48177  ORF Transcript_24100/g.48177 Transcript_24100/m.48177 type:complete len:274 (+) Transcript_24100:132-953(+)